MTHPHNTDAEPGRVRLRRRRTVAAIVGGGVLLAVVSFFAFRSRTFRSKPILDSAEAKLARSEYSEAAQLVRRVIQREPKNVRAMFLAGKVAAAQKRFAEAVEWYSRIPAENPPWSVEAAWRAGDMLLLNLRRPAAAEIQYRRALTQDPACHEANDRLAFLMGFTARWWEQIPPRLATIRAGKFLPVQLFILALGESALENPELVGTHAETSPDDSLVLLARARLKLEQLKPEEAIPLLRQAIQRSPQLAEAHVRFGGILLQYEDWSALRAWHVGLPTTADAHPGIWVIRGRWALQQSRRREALRCFCEAVVRDPNHADALYQAGRILTAKNQPRDAAAFLNRLQELRAFINAVKAAHSDNDLAAMERASRLADSLGNGWEAFGWATVAARHPSRPQWAADRIARWKPLLSKLPLQRTATSHNPAAGFPYREYPLPALAKAGVSKSKLNFKKQTAVAFSFQDRAAEAGLPFRYYNGSNSVLRGTKKMYEVMGGGIAVLDFNGDLRPDLYVTQGCRWPVNETDFTQTDRLFLNTGNGRFVDITEFAGIRENRFSQGVTVGDINSDGFPDLLVGNIGRNRLYRNNGDGTMTDISRSAGFDRADWTTSCAIADLSGDGHPEIYVVNYLKGDDVFTRMCGGRSRGVCLPQHFPAAADRLLFNDGRGGFRDVTQSAGIAVPNGKGLGIVVGRFGNSLRPGIFIANDTVANFLFTNRGNSAKGVPRFRENGLASGLAFNDTGRTEACMGIAAGDADGDGRIDFFVTNFHGESNTLYRQLPGGTFADETRRRGLHGPSLSKLGFGTQFLDANLDGELDLIVANGHIENDRGHRRAEYQMQPQFFGNLGRGRFQEATAMGKYFQRKVLGRSLARLDWNGDGRPDVVVSHLDAPLSLLENTTANAGRSVALILRGVNSNREAIGAVVRVETATGRKLMRQLTAGDGFQASNERLLIFGLGNRKQVRKLTVEWPSGRIEEFANFPTNSRWIVVEGSSRILAVSW